jgi:hypothetical protein
MFHYPLHTYILYTGSSGRIFSDPVAYTENNGFGSQKNNLATPREVATHGADLRSKQADKKKSKQAAAAEMWHTGLQTG